MAAYQAALASAPAPVGADRSAPRLVNAAVASYYASPPFKAMAASTQQVRRAVLEAFRREHGDKLIAAMPTKFLRALLDAMEPSTAKNWLVAIRALTTYAIAADLIEQDPTLGIKLRRMSGDGYHTWTEDEIAQFELCIRSESRERLAMALGLFTGQRRGDVIRMGRQHIRGDLLAVKQQKTGKPLLIPVHPELRMLLDMVPPTQLTFITTQRGQPYKGKAFTQRFAEACDAAGLPSVCTFHGLRKVGGSRRRAAPCTRSRRSRVTRR